MTLMHDAKNIRTVGDFPPERSSVGETGRANSGPDGLYAHLKGVVILGGAVRPSALSEGIQRSFFDLPLNPKEKLLDRWVAEVRAMAVARAMGHVPVKVMLDAGSSAPADRVFSAES